MVDPAEADEPVRRMLGDIRDHHRHPAAATYFRALANWPNFLDEIWRQLRPQVGTPDYESRKAALVSQTDGLSLLLISGTEPQIDLPDDVRNDLRAIVDVFRCRLIPDLLMDVCLIKAILDGPGAAERSRFSAAARQDR